MESITHSMSVLVQNYRTTSRFIQQKTSKDFPPPLTDPFLPLPLWSHLPLSLLLSGPLQLLSLLFLHRPLWASLAGCLHSCSLCWPTSPIHLCYLLPYLFVAFAQMSAFFLGPSLAILFNVVSLPQTPCSLLYLFCFRTCCLTSYVFVLLLVVCLFQRGGRGMPLQWRFCWFLRYLLEQCLVLHEQWDELTEEIFARDLRAKFNWMQALHRETKEKKTW